MGQVVAPVTEAEVEAAVQSLIASGVHPSVRRVREAVGRGSMTTINSMLGKVRASSGAFSLPAVAMARPQMMVLPAPANQAMGPSAREIELERELAEERGRVAELRAQLAKMEAEQVEAVAGSTAAEMTGEAVGQTKMLLREAPGYHRDLLHALRAVEIAGEWMRQQFQPAVEPLKLVADIEGAPPVLTAAAAARAKPRAKAAQRTRKD
jgi:hypothetical protein